MSHSLSFFTIFLFVLVFSNFAKADDCQSLYKLDKGQCGELCLSSTIAPFAIKFGGVVAGQCKDQGYLIFDHTEKISVGPFGEFDVKIYKKTQSTGFLEY